jgi:hypothetical protein
VTNAEVHEAECPSVHPLLLRGATARLDAGLGFAYHHPLEIAKRNRAVLIAGHINNVPLDYCHI